MGREDELSIWTIYDHPGDYRRGFIARRFVVGRVRGVAIATQDVMESPSLRGLRQYFAMCGLVRLARQEGDDPVVVESWI